MKQRINRLVKPALFILLLCLVIFIFAFSFNSTSYKRTANAAEMITIVPTYIDSPNIDDPLEYFKPNPNPPPDDLYCVAAAYPYSVWGNAGFNAFKGITCYTYTEKNGEWVIDEEKPPAAPTSFTVKFTHINNSALTYTFNGSGSSGSWQGGSRPLVHGAYKLAFTTTGPNATNSNYSDYVVLYAGTDITLRTAGGFSETYGRTDGYGNLLDYKNLFTFDINNPSASDLNLAKYLFVGSSVYNYNEGMSYGDLGYGKINQTAISGLPSGEYLHLGAVFEEKVTNAYNAGKYKLKLYWYDSAGKIVKHVLFPQRTGDDGVAKFFAYYELEFTITPKEVNILPYYEYTAGDGSVTKTGTIVLQTEKTYSQLQSGEGDASLYAHTARKDFNGGSVLSPDIYRYLLEYGIFEFDLRKLFLWSTKTYTTSARVTAEVSNGQTVLTIYEGAAVRAKITTSGTVTNQNGQYSVKGGYTELSTEEGNSYFDRLDLTVTVAGNTVTLAYPKVSELLLYDYIFVDNGNGTFSDPYSSYLIDDLGNLSPNVGTGKILSLVFAFNNEVEILKNYIAVANGNQQLYNQGYAQSANDGDWMKNHNGENEAGIILLAKRGAEQTVTDAGKAGITFPASLKTYTEKYLSLTAQNKEAIFNYLSTVSGGSVFTGNISSVYNALTVHDFARAMVFYYGDGYKKGTTVKGANGTYVTKVTLYGAPYKAFTVVPANLELDIIKYTSLPKYAAAVAGGNADGSVPVNKEEYGFKNTFSYAMYPKPNAAVIKTSSISYIAYAALAAMGMNVKLFVQNDPSNLTNTLSVLPVLCRDFIYGVDLTPDYEFASKRYVKVAANSIMNAGTYYFIFEYYFEGVLINLSDGEVYLDPVSGGLSVALYVKNSKILFKPVPFYIERKILVCEGITAQNIETHLKLGKIYDGLYQVYPSASNTEVYMSGDFAGFNKYLSILNLVAPQINAEDRDVLGVLVSPVYGQNGNPNMDSGNAKDIIINFRFYFIEEGPGSYDERYTRYLNAFANYSPPEQLIFSGISVIDKRTVDFAFENDGAPTKTETIIEAVKEFLGVENPTQAQINAATAVLSSFYPDTQVISFETPYGSQLYNIFENQKIVFGEYERDIYGNIIKNEQTLVQKTRMVKTQDIDIFGNAVYIVEYVTDDQGNPVMVPKVKNDSEYFLPNENPYDVYNDLETFNWQSFINFSYYYIPGENSMTISGYYFDRNSASWMVRTVNENTPGAQRATRIDENTLPTGNHPGIKINLNSGFELKNYSFETGAMFSTAFMVISKKIYDLALNANQTADYLGKKHTSMREQLIENRPVYEVYQALGKGAQYETDMNLYKTYASLLTISLDGHSEAESIIGPGGLGVEIKILEYAFPGETALRPVQEIIDDPSTPAGYHPWLIRMRDEGEIMNSGKYYLSVILPETNSYKKTVAKYATLTINRAEIRISLSNSERLYNSPNPALHPTDSLASTVYEEKLDTSETGSWGWKVYTDSYMNYSSTLCYKFISRYKGSEIDLFETPYTISNAGFSFTHCGIDYGSLNLDSPVDRYNIYSSGGDTFNYTFVQGAGVLHVLAARAYINVLFDGAESPLFTLQADYGGSENIKIVNLEYNGGVTNWVLIRRNAGNASDPRAIFRYVDENGYDVKGIDIDAVLSSVVGYISIDAFAAYQSSLPNHFGNAVGTNGSPIMDGNKYTIGFFPKVGDVDLTPPDRMRNASNSGYYIMRLYAPGENCRNYIEPFPVYVIMKIDYTDMVIEVHPEAQEKDYDGFDYILNQGLDDLGGYGFYTNNLEISRYITIYSGDSFITAGSSVTGLRNAVLMGGNEDVFAPDAIKMLTYTFDNTGIINVGFYKIVVTFKYTGSDAVQNYRLPADATATIYIKINKSVIKVSFGNAEGEENWVYNGKPYEMIDPAETGDPSLQGFTYRTIPGVRYIKDSLGNIIGQYYEIPMSQMRCSIYRVSQIYPVASITFDALGNPIVPGGTCEYTSAAKDAGIYLIVLQALGGSNPNFSDSLPTAQYYVIDRAEVTLRIIGALIPPDNTDRYEVSKKYGEALPVARLEIIYQGWADGEDETNVSGFNPATIDWDGITPYTNAGHYNIYARNPLGCDNYVYVSPPVEFIITKASAEVYVNQSLTKAEYTGAEQQTRSVFRANRAPLPGENTAEMPFAFSLNYDPNSTMFNIVLAGKIVNNSLDTSVKNCVDVGTYEFMISASESTNYFAFSATAFRYEVVKAKLVPHISNASMTYGESSYPFFEVYYTGFVGKDAAGLTEANKPVYRINPDGRVTLKSGTPIATFIGLEHISVITGDAINVRENGYTVTCDSGNSENYYFDCSGVTANLMINKRDITVKASGVVITREYNRNTRTVDKNGNSVIIPAHYVFENAITVHPMRPGDGAVTINLLYSSVFDSPGVGENKRVMFSELSVDNENFNLTTVSFEAKGTIYAFTPNVSMVSNEYVYDGTAKTLTPIVRGYSDDGITFESVSYSVLYSELREGLHSLETPEPPKTAGVYTVKVMTNDPNYTTLTLHATLTIKKADVTIRLGGDINQQFGKVSGLTATAKGLMGYSVSITPVYFDNKGNSVDDIVRAGAGTYTVKAIFAGSANYNAKTVTEQLVISPITVNAIFVAGEDTYLYDGQGKYQVARFIDVYGQTVTALIKYYRFPDGGSYSAADIGAGIESQPVKVGTYLAVAESPNANYVLQGELETSFRIIKRDLIIGIGNTVMDAGGSANFSYINIGIAAGETEKSLETPPEISYFDETLYKFVPGLPQKSGIYRIIPFGASDSNYNITYSEGLLTVNKTELVFNTDMTAGLVLKGSFSPDLTVRVTMLYESGYSTVKNSYDLFKAGVPELKNTQLLRIYQISSGKEITDDIKIMIKLSEFGDIAGTNSAIADGKSFKMAAVYRDGTVTVIESETIENGYVVFNVSGLTSFGIIGDTAAENNMLWIYIAIAAGILVIIGVIILLRKRA